MAKLTNLNAHYLREMPDAELLPLVLPRIEAKLGGKIDPVGLERIERGMNGVKQRSRTLVELADNLVFYARDGAPPIADDKARAQLTPDAKALLARLAAALERRRTTGASKQIEEAIRRFAEARGREARPGRPAAARGAQRLDRVARHLRGRWRSWVLPRPSRDCWPPADRRLCPDRHSAAMGLRVWIWLLSLSVLWGGSFFFAKVAIGELGPLTVVFARVALAALALDLVLLAARRIRFGATRRGPPTSPWAS